MKALSTVTDPRIVKALAHPLRVRILGALERRTASPSELADEFGAPLGNVSYHVRQLEALGLIKLVKTTPRRGAVEHHYRLDARPSVTDDAWSKAPPIVKEALLGAVLGQIGDQVASAAVAGGFDRADTHVSRLPLVFDEKGFKAAARELGLLVERLKRIEEQSLGRLKGADRDGRVESLAVLMLLEAADTRSEPPSAASPARDRSHRGKGEATKPRRKAASRR
jgi:DNA-binding transcriptional ArsR family regulator